MRVLLVEDDILIRIFIKNCLTKNGCDEVYEASKSDEAIKVVENHKPDIVFLDIKLKGEINGVEIARILRSGVAPEIILVYMSAYDQTVFNEGEINSLFDYHLSKPVNPGELKELCKKITTRESRDDE